MNDVRGEVSRIHPFSPYFTDGPMALCRNLYNFSNPRRWDVTAETTILDVNVNLLVVALRHTSDPVKGARETRLPKEGVPAGLLFCLSLVRHCECCCSGVVFGGGVGSVRTVRTARATAAAANTKHHDEATTSRLLVPEKAREAESAAPVIRTMSPRLDQDQVL